MQGGGAYFPALFSIYTQITKWIYWLYKQCNKKWNKKEITLPCSHSVLCIDVIWDSHLPFHSLVAAWAQAAEQGGVFAALRGPVRGHLWGWGRRWVWGYGLVAAHRCLVCGDAGAVPHGWHLNGWKAADIKTTFKYWLRFIHSKNRQVRLCCNTENWRFNYYYSVSHWKSLWTNVTKM